MERGNGPKPFRLKTTNWVDGRKETGLKSSSKSSCVRNPPSIVASNHNAVSESDTGDIDLTTRYQTAICIMKVLQATVGVAELPSIAAAFEWLQRPCQ